MLQCDRPNLGWRFDWKEIDMLRQTVAARILSAVLGIAATFAAAHAQSGAAADTDEARIEDLVTASHMLANEGILDSFGHVTVRSATHPDHFFMPRAMPPALVSRADIVELDLDCKPLLPNAPRLNGERYIHCEIYWVRDDVQSVIHTHDLAVIPFGLTSTPLRPVVAQAGFLPQETPLFEVRDAHSSAAERGMLVLNSSLGKALAAKLADNPVVLMRGHGETVVGRSVKEATVRTFYTNLDAQAQAAAMSLGSRFVVLDDAERAAYAKEERPDRPWENYKQRMLKGQGSPR
jgi:HCOMODA/2-hydroxy-3-carboxy-muconic semialdehyde decarboxylase